MRLVVVQNFSLTIHDATIEYQKGNEITDPDVVDAVLKSENARYVLKTANVE